MLNPPKHHSILSVLLLVFLLSMGSGRLLSQDQSPEEYLRIAGEAEKRENFARAEKIYLEAASKYPNQPEIFKRLGVIYQTELKFQESIDTFQKVLAGAPQYPEVNFYLGLSYFGLNQFEKSISYFDTELEANPKYRRAHFYVSDAVPLLEIVVAAEPNYMKGYYLLGKCYAAKGKLQDAVKLLQRAAELDQNDKGVHYQLGQIYRRLNQPDKSRTEMETFERLYAQERELKAKRIEGSYKDREAPKN